MNCRQWVVDVNPCRRPHACGSCQLPAASYQSGSWRLGTDSLGAKPRELFLAHAAL